LLSSAFASSIIFCASFLTSSLFACFTAVSENLISAVPGHSGDSFLGAAAGRWLWRGDEERAVEKAGDLLAGFGLTGQANDYVGTLERINSVGMAVAIVDMIPDDATDLKNKARIDLIKQILTMSKAVHHEL